MKHPYYEDIDMKVAAPDGDEVEEAIKEFADEWALFHELEYAKVIADVRDKFLASKTDDMPDGDLTIITRSEIPFIVLDNPTPPPYEEMYDEAKRLEPFFVNHRSYATNVEANTINKWQSLSLYGFSHAHTGIPEDYGFVESNKLEKEYMDWTDLSKFCPATVKWLKEDWAYPYFSRVRFMILRSGGIIAPHSDQDNHELVPVNVCLNMPDDCYWLYEKFGRLPYKPGTISFKNISYQHAVWNRSDVDRIHLIIYGGRNDAKFRNLIVNGLEKAYEKYCK